MSPRVTAAVAASRRAGVVLLGVLLMVPPYVASPGAAARAAAQVLTWTADDDITRYRSAPTQAEAGATTIVFENSAATGNTTGMPHTLTFDTTTAGYNHDVDINILASPFDPNNGRHEVAVTLTPGRYRYFCAIPGHSEMVGEFVVTAGPGDTTPPTVSAAVSGTRDADGNYVGVATVTVAASDTGSGVDTVEYEVDDTGFQPYTGPVPVSSIGDHAVQFRATDKAGNVSPVGSVSFRVVEAGGRDTTPPTVTAEVSGTRDAAGNYVGTATATITATDTQSGVATVEYSLDGAAFAPYTAPIVVGAVGAHLLHYRAVDVAGNASAEKMVSFTVVTPPVPDTTPPTVAATLTGERDAAGNYLGAATVTVTATDAQSGVQAVQYSLDGGAFVAYTSPVAVNAAGPHVVRYRATDVAGNTSPDGSTSFTVVAAPDPDTTPPTTSAEVTGQRDGNGAYLGSATVTITATDSGSGVASIEYAFDAQAWTRYTGAITVRTTGAHTVRYRATDIATNRSAERSVAFTVVQAGTDACPDSDTRRTVIIRGDDTGVVNVDTGNGCTINDLIAERAPYPDHASFVRHVQTVTNTLVTSGKLSRRQQGTIVRAAARSDVGT